MNFTNYLKESIIDIPKNSLDPDVFTFNEGQAPTLKDSVKAQILKDIEQIQKAAFINKFYMIGSILTRRYSKNSDIDVNVEIFKEEITELDFKNLLHILKSINGKLANGTSHPINYFITTDDYDLNKTEAAYDIINNRWIKEPKFFNININNYIQNFQNIVSNIDLTTAELRRDIIDLEYLKQLDKDDIKNIKSLVKQKIYEINSSISYLIDLKNNFKKVRKYEYDRPMTPEEIKQFSSKNLIPSEITYKLLQKYYYWDFINKLEDIVGDKSEVSSNDIDDIKRAEKDFWSYYSESNTLKESIRRIKVKKIDWKKPSSINSHVQKLERGFSRKTLSQVPKVKWQRYSSWRNLGTAKKVVDNAKKASSGLWRVTQQQVKEISNKYHFYPPNQHDNIKHLGNTGIILWRKERGVYFLIKPTIKHKI